MLQKWIPTVLIALVLMACNDKPLKTNNQSHLRDIAPEATATISGIKKARASDFMAVTAHPLATRTAYNILKQGGSAMDAAIAAQLVLGLVEPQSSGIGGGGFLLHWQQQQQRLQFFDGREVAPAKVNASHFLNTEHQPMGFFEAVIGGHAVGVPGIVHMLETAHKQHGKLPWKQLFQPAIKLAENGFKISERLHYSLANTPKVASHPAIKNYFFDAEQPKAIGSLLINKEYAESLKLIAEQGSRVFYEGILAEKIVAAVNNDPVKTGKLSLSDLSHYQSHEREALCSDYKSYTVCTAAPPSSGITVLQILGMLEFFDAEALTPANTRGLHYFAEASKRAFADRDSYIADPDFINIPTDELLDKHYLQQRFNTISATKSSEKALPGLSQHDAKLADSPELPSTTHFAIIDAAGNAVSMTSSIEMGFGSRILVAGFLLNNQLTDFSFAPSTAEQAFIANRIEAGKRPRSSMSPTIVFKDKKPLMLIGSPGGSRIIDFVAKTLLYTLNGNLGIAEAIASPHIIHMNRQLELEQGRFDESQKQLLKSYGHEIKERDLNSGLHGIWIDSTGLHGGADPRREGSIMGE